MNFVLFILIGIAIFMSVLLGGRRYRSTALYALAIGGVVNANFFHAGNYPIDCFGLPFGIDSLIYTLFVFCIVVMFLKIGKKSAYLLMVSSVIAILISAIIQILTQLLSTGTGWAEWSAFLGFVVSSFASIFAITVMLEVLNPFRKKLNQYVLLIIGIILATTVNSAIYYPLSILITGEITNIGMLLLTSFIGKAIAMLISIPTLCFINLIDSQGNKRKKKKANKHKNAK